MQEFTFNPIDYGFEWTDNWYNWDRTAAHNQAKKERNEQAKKFRQQGYKVKCFSVPNQLMTKGGIGTGSPQIENFVTIYGLYVMPKEYILEN